MAALSAYPNFSAISGAGGFTRERNVKFTRQPAVTRAALSTQGTTQYEEGDLERPRWTGETPLSRLVGAIISFKPLFSLLKIGARRVLISTAEKTNIPWRQMTTDILESEDVYKEMDSVLNKSIVYPSYYLNPFHAYDEGNLSWLGLDLSPYFLAVAKFKEKKNNISRKNPISWLHAKGEETGLPAKSFDIVSIAYVFHECPKVAIINLVKEALRLLRPGGTIAITDNSPKSKILQELSPVLFTLMKSTEPFLDEYYLTDLEGTMREAGFVNVETILTDPRHRTVTGTVPPLLT
ncbi:uncharacterized protein LOC124929509 isoform X2 [Impatiens glandulifera]|uniref:uncharacterized protein LOC124929509 isoform X2 n=1 Tax=Impatiens glandulifera TaxID=253017 RepID=UPI001FB10483|nr:uncharacterized protein LOC124929509 isoform X2 [Impatiens glandulifera]